VAHAYAADPGVRAFDKVTGAPLGFLSLRSAGLLAMVRDESSFWTLLRDGSGTIARHAVPGIGDTKAGERSPPPLVVVAGLPTACSIAVHPVTDELWVVDRKSQSIARFSSAGAPNGSFGVDLNLSFPYIVETGHPSGTLVEGEDMVCPSVSFTDDGSEVWISDAGNRRILRVDVQSERIQDHVMFLTVQYAAAADWANPRRVFSNFLEFEVDYATALSPDGGWRFVRNWGTHLPPGYHAQVGLTHWSFAGFVSVVTLGQHTVAKVSFFPDDLNATGQTADSETRLVELMPGSNSTLRSIMTFRQYPRPDLHPDGSLHWRQSHGGVAGHVGPILGQLDCIFRDCQRHHGRQPATAHWRPGPDVPHHGRPATGLTRRRRQATYCPGGVQLPEF